MLARTLAAALALASLAAPARARADDRAKADPVKGIWAVTSVVYGGVKVPDDPTEGPSVAAFDGASYAQRQGSKIVEEGTYVVDFSRNPMTIDFTIKAGPDAGKKQVGLVKVVDNILTLSLAPAGSEKRPKDFDSPSGSERLVVTARKTTP